MEQIDHVFMKKWFPNLHNGEFYNISIVTNEKAIGVDENL